MRKGFTLVEILVVITIFSIVSVVTLNAFLTALRSEQRANIENAVLQDARYIMETIAYEIKNGTIDYEEYFNQCVIGKKCPNDFTSGSSSEYGANHGYYNWQFYFGGYQDNTFSAPTDGFGPRCQAADTSFHDYPDENCVTGPLAFSEDYATGQNPTSPSNDGSIVENASALCADGGYQLFTDKSDGIESGTSQIECSDVDTSSMKFLTMNELYLINEEGNKKTIIVRERISSGLNNDYAVSKVELDKSGQLINGEISYPIFGFKCTSEYSCSTKNSLIESHGLNNSQVVEFVPLRKDPYGFSAGENMFNDFVPISPLRVNVKSLKFIISPVEDPYLSFAEPDNNKLQPMVTILLEIEPSDSIKMPFFSANFNLKLQTTVSAGVTSAIPLEEG